MEAPNEVLKLLLKDSISFLDGFDFQGLAGTDLFERFDTCLLAICVPKNDTK